MQAGFAKVDITPRVGVELCGFGAFLNRHSIGVRDNLWARAMAVEKNENTALVISCDLIGITRKITARVRELIQEKFTLPDSAIMLHATHTHSGPMTADYIGWGDIDYPYVEILPHWIADSALKALDNLEDVTVKHAVTPCEGIGLNREYDQDAPPLEKVLDENWRPAKPELTDTQCQVVKFENSKRKMIGFFSYFGCHPVVCCSTSRYIHGDFVGVATNLLERENPGSVGLFLQGAQGDVNSCVVHKPEQEAILALDIIATRYARHVRHGLQTAQNIEIDKIAFTSQKEVFSRREIPLATLQEWLAEYEAIFSKKDIRDDDSGLRMNTVYAKSLRSLIARVKDKSESLFPATEIQGIKIGPLSLLGSPFEIFQAIKNEVVQKSPSQHTLVMGLTADSCGYAPDRQTAANGGYADKTVPLIFSALPFANIHQELAAALQKTDEALNP